MATNRRSRHTLLVVGLVVGAAVAAFACSLFVDGEPARPVPFVAVRAPDVENDVVRVGQGLPRDPAEGRDVDVRLSVRATAPRPGQVVLATGMRPNAGFRILVVSSGRGSATLQLNGPETAPAGHARAVTLVSPLEPQREYEVHVRIAAGRRVSGDVNDRDAFAYDFGESGFDPTIDTLSVGGDVTRGQAFGGSVANLVLRHRDAVEPYKPTVLRRILQLTTGLLLGGLAIGALVRGAPQLWGLQRPQPDGRSSQLQLTAWRSFVSRRRGRRLSVALSAGFMVGGLLLLAAATPPGNAMVKRVGARHIGPIDVPAGTSLRFPLANEQSLFDSAESIDLIISGRVRPDGSRPSGDITPLVVGTGQRPSVGISLGPGRAIVSEEGSPIPGQLTADQWSRLEVRVTRSRHIEYRVNGRRVFEYSYERPVLIEFPPDGFLFGSGVRDARVDLLLFERSDSSTLQLHRAGQLAGALALVGGIVAMSSLASTRLLPGRKPVSRHLAVVVFGTLGAGLIINIAVALLHLQQSASPLLPRNTWLLYRGARFTDFFEVIHGLRSLEPYAGGTASYPPFAYWIVAPFVWMRDMTAVLAFLIAFGAFFAWWCWRYLGAGLRPTLRIGVVVLALASYPVTFGADRGNVDLGVVVLVIIGVGAFAGGHRRAAAIILGLATAAKLAPGIFLLLFWRKGSRRHLLLALTVTLAAGFVSAGAFHGGLGHNLAGFWHGLQGLPGFYDGGSTSVRFNTSIHGWIGAIAFAIGGDAGVADVRDALEVVRPALLAAGTAGLGWFITRSRRELWQTVTLLTAGMLLLQDVSYDYHLAFLFVPLALFLANAPLTPSTSRVGLLFGLLLMPKAYFWLGDSYVNTGVFMTAPILVTLVVTVLRHRAGPGRSVPWDDSARVDAPSLEPAVTREP